MATLTQLKDARNAGLNLAKATQDFAQVDILSVDKDAPEVVATLQAAADAAIAAGIAIGGTAATPPLPPTDAIVSSGVALTVPVTGTYVSKATPTVAGGVVTGIVLS